MIIPSSLALCPDFSCSGMTLNQSYEAVLELQLEDVKNVDIVRFHTTDYLQNDPFLHYFTYCVEVETLQKCSPVYLLYSLSFLLST